MIPRHKGKNLLGISSGFISNPFCFVQEVAAEMGDFYQLTIPGYRIYVISDPELLKKITTGNSHLYGKGRIYWKQLARGIGEGLATTEGPQWLFRRRLMHTYFSKAAIAGYIPAMGRIAADYFRRHLETGGIAATADSMELASGLTAEITLFNLLGIELPESRSGFYERIKRAQEFIFYCSRYPWNRMLTFFNGKKKQFDKDVSYFDQVIYQYILERRRDPFPPYDLFTALLQAKNEKGELLFTDKQVRDEFITLLGGGSENSSACFSWTLYLLWKHPEKLALVREEADRLLAHRPGFTESLVEQFRYTELVLKESLRLYPPGYTIVREAKDNDVLRGEKIPKGATLYIASNVLHRHPAYWKDPDTFRPERFSGMEDAAGFRDAYLPFGAGQHTCIGLHFAMAELRIMLALLVHHYDFSLASREPVMVESAITPQAKGGLLFSFRKRKIPVTQKPTGVVFPDVGGATFPEQSKVSSFDDSGQSFYDGV